MESVKRRYRQCFLNWPFPSLGEFPELFWCCLLWECRRTAGGGKGQGIRAGETGSFQPHFNQSGSTSVLYIRLKEDSPKECIPELRQFAKRYRIALWQKGQGLGGQTDLVKSPSSATQLAV